MLYVNTLLIMQLDVFMLLCVFVQLFLWLRHRPDIEVYLVQELLPIVLQLAWYAIHSFPKNPGHLTCIMYVCTD